MNQTQQQQQQRQKPLSSSFKQHLQWLQKKYIVTEDREGVGKGVGKA